MRCHVRDEGTRGLAGLSIISGSTLLTYRFHFCFILFLLHTHFYLINTYRPRQRQLLVSCAAAMNALRTLVADRNKRNDSNNPRPDQVLQSCRGEQRILSSKRPVSNEYIGDGVQLGKLSLRSKIKAQHEWYDRCAIRRLKMNRDKIRDKAIHDDMTLRWLRKRAPRRESENQRSS